MEPLCLFDAASVCFPTVSLPPSLFLFAAQYLSTFHPLFSLSVCFPSLISLSLSVCFSPLFSLCVSLRKRLRHCGGGCSAGAEEIFFLSECYCQSWPITLDTHIYAPTHTHTSDVKHTSNANNYQSRFGTKWEKKPSTGPNRTQLTW